MYGLPPSTQIGKQLPKKSIYAKFELTPAQRNSFDADISKIEISAVVSSVTIPSLSDDGDTKEFYVLTIHLKKQDYDVKNIVLLTKLIPQKMILVLKYEDLGRLAVVYHKANMMSDWENYDDIALHLSGLNVTSVWENIIKSIGRIEIEEENTLAKQIEVNTHREKILKQIALLERKMATEKQPHRKRAYFEQIKKLKGQII